jgi:hypothetical protein
VPFSKEADLVLVGQNSNLFSSRLASSRLPSNSSVKRAKNRSQSEKAADLIVAFICQYRYGARLQQLLAFTEFTYLWLLANRIYPLISTQ